MGFFDLFELILDNLGRRIGRVALTAIGVVIGTAAIVILVSLAIGLQISANERLFGIGDLTQIVVEPNYGEFVEGGPRVVVEAVPFPGGGSNTNQQLITDQSLADLAQLPNVVSVIPRDYMQGGGMMIYNRLEGYIGITGIGIADLSQLGLKAQGGSLEMQHGEAIIGAMVPMNFYDPRPAPGKEPPPPPELLDQTVKLILQKWDNEGNEIRKSLPIKIRGVIAESKTEADWSVYMPIEDLASYNQWFLGRRINRSKDGYPSVLVKVSSLDDVISTSDQINAMGYRAYTQLTYVQGINSFYTILQVIFGGVGAIALLVAAIGIANTMAMSILERTREIGLMKAVGATNRDVLSVFLGEAAGIGFLGGLGGVVIGWSVGQALNALALAYLARQATQTGAPPPSVAVFTPLWLPVFALVFSILIGVLSGLYPALRAATLVPVNALKYE
jgi:putative ABC transport system permease protein